MSKLLAYIERQLLTECHKLPMCLDFVDLLNLLSVYTEPAVNRFQIFKLNEDYCALAQSLI